MPVSFSSHNCLTILFFSRASTVVFLYSNAHHTLTIPDGHVGDAGADMEVTLYHKQFYEIEQYALKRMGRAVTLKMGDKVSWVNAYHHHIQREHLFRTVHCFCSF